MAALDHERVEQGPAAGAPRRPPARRLLALEHSAAPGSRRDEDHDLHLELWAGREGPGLECAEFLALERLDLHQFHRERGERAQCLGQVMRHPGPSVAARLALELIQLGQREDDGPLARGWGGMRPATPKLGDELG
ncbi:MAG: hypothetical protein AB1Z98_39580 [Nannocystaceae bacterium]